VSFVGDEKLKRDRRLKYIEPNVLCLGKESSKCETFHFMIALSHLCLFGLRAHH
jgi:hypothetical protein